MEKIIQIISAILTGGVLWEIIKFFWPEIKKYFKDRIDAKKALYENIDPLIKSADELIGKINSFAKTDFKEVSWKSLTETKEEIYIERIYTNYLFAAVWGYISILRRNENFSKIAKFKKGEIFLKFVYNFESKKNRIISRGSQRIIGDSMILIENGKPQIKSIYQFTQDLTIENSGILKLIMPLDMMLRDSYNTKIRQKFFLYGVLLQSFSDYFASSAGIINKRMVYKNKLTKRTKNELNHRLFKVYLPFIKNKSRYF